MAMQPARVKFRKMHRGSRTGLARSGHTVAFGEYGLMALERCWMDAKQIEAARVAIARHMKRHGKMWIRVFPQKINQKDPRTNPEGKRKGLRGRGGGGPPGGKGVVGGGRGGGRGGGETQ